MKTESIVRAFEKIKREDFVLDEFKKEAEEDIALSIGYGQTISQPLTVVFMLELLDPKPGQKILDVGSGSGWTTALLSYIVGKKGEVAAMERKEELKSFGEANADKYGFVREGIAKFILGDGSRGYQKYAPYDRILVSASADCAPNALKDQLGVFGKMVIPVGDSIWLMEKTGENKFRKKEYSGFMFVPLVESK